MTNEPTTWQQPPTCKHERTFTLQRFGGGKLSTKCLDCGLVLQ